MIVSLPSEAEVEEAKKATEEGRARRDSSNAA